MKSDVIFDRNQSSFPSDFHREVWWWAVGIVPPTESLTAEVTGKCGADVLEGCYQWHAYFNRLCADMYVNAAEYSPATARQYRDLLEGISLLGEIRGDAVMIGETAWDAYTAKLDKSKAFASNGITTGRLLAALGRTGLETSRGNGLVCFANAEYPKSFHAMYVMERSPNIRKTPARLHFAHCEFRQLFKSYSPPYDGLLRRVSDESLSIARSVHECAKTLKIQRYVHFDTIKYKYNGVRVLDFSVCGNEYPTLRINIGTNAGNSVSGDEFYKRLACAGPDVIETFARVAPFTGDPNHARQTVVLGGRAVEVCPGAKIMINPFASDAGAILWFIRARKASIELLGT